MPASHRDQTAAAILRERVSAIIRTKDQALAGEAMQAAVDGGFRLVEVTMTTPGALELVAEFAKQSNLVVGAGTVLSVEMARGAVAAGARFLVSPICDPQVLAEARRLDAATLPGAFTPAEMQNAHRCGADFVKLFPAPPGGPDYVEAVLLPLPHLRLFPTAAVTPDNFTRWLDAGCAGVGFVRSLFDPQDLARRDFAAIKDRASTIIRRLAAWRSGAALGHDPVR